jgi:hypothetical protein
MEMANDPLMAASERIPNAPEGDVPLDENDPELEREFEELAQWLLEAYLYRRRQNLKPDDAQIDKEHPTSTI